MPGGGFRHAGKAPLFQEVEAHPLVFERYIADLVADCTRQGVVIRCGTDVRADPALLAPFDRLVVATGARARFGLGALAPALLDLGAGRWPGLRRLLADPKLRDWFYYRARTPTADRIRALARPGQTVIAIGDAVAAGKSKEAIRSAFDAALLGAGGRAG